MQKNPIIRMSLISLKYLEHKEANHFHNNRKTRLKKARKCEKQTLPKSQNLNEKKIFKMTVKYTNSYLKTSTH
jgi:hypothetical protein